MVRRICICVFSLALCAGMAAPDTLETKGKVLEGVYVTETAHRYYVRSLADENIHSFKKAEATVELSEDRQQILKEYKKRWPRKSALGPVLRARAIIESLSESERSAEYLPTPGPGAAQPIELLVRPEAKDVLSDVDGDRGIREKLVVTDKSGVKAIVLRGNDRSDPAWEREKLRRASSLMEQIRAERAWAAEQRMAEQRMAEEWEMGWEEWDEGYYYEPFPEFLPEDEFYFYGPEW